MITVSLMRTQSSRSNQHERGSRGRASKPPGWSNAPAWLAALAWPPVDGRPIVLVVADPPTEQRIAAIARVGAREVALARTPLDAVQFLERRGDQIDVAILSSRVDWGLQLRDLIATDYPDVRRIFLVG